jgi:hypothetical protein
MEQVIDKVISELNTFIETPDAQGGCSDIMQIAAVYFGDPGVIPVNSYPAFTVEPVRDEPLSETIGYEVRRLVISISLLIDAREYFDADVLEASGDRDMVRTMANLRRWLRTTSNRQMDGLEGVREASVSATDYMVQVRDSVIAKSAVINFVVDRQYSRQA